MNTSLALVLSILAGTYTLSILLILWVLTRALGKQFQQVSKTRYDYKVVDLIILQDPDNHEKQIQRWANEGWSIVACMPLIGGATEGAAEVRYILSKPWQLQRLVQAVKDEAKQLQAENSDTVTKE